MKVSNFLAYFALATSAANAASIPEINAINLIEDRADAQPRAAEVVAPDHSLERRKGGGGRGGGGSSGGSSGGGRSSGSSMAGGSTRSGSGAPRAYGGGYYGGGAAVPYQAGSRTPKGLVAAPLLLGAGALAIMPGLWLYSVYPYHYNNPVSIQVHSSLNMLLTILVPVLQQDKHHRQQPQRHKHYASSHLLVSGIQPLRLRRKRRFQLFELYSW